MDTTDNNIRILAIDVGAGTQDILLYDSGQPMENCVKLVVPCQTVIVARRIARATERGEHIFLAGNLMGGGACVRAVTRHIESGLRVYATELAAKTLNDNLDKVRHTGVEIVDAPPTDAAEIDTRDIDLGSLRQALGIFETELPDRFAVAVQDHGESVRISNREFRFEHFRRIVKAGGELRHLAFRSAPEYLTRMVAVQRDVPNCIVMDTGPAAIWGSLYDPIVAERNEGGIIMVNIGNAHTFGALVRDRRIWGLFEHHTGGMTPDKLANYVKRLRQADLPHEEVFADGGHGSYVHPDFDAGSGFGFVSVTGPNRGMANGLGYHFAAPFGDMMLTGCFGLVGAAIELEGI
ncbi:MAG: DUF1786 domain-containing protein [Chloroflexi bacterium]|nr:DUF1786 domain-containing protein [Chloroflexota bacterium]MDA8188136.1 DUF1786 domain-containing protein [Dehalococcoidales bacterium]